MIDQKIAYFVMAGVFLAVGPPHSKAAEAAAAPAEQQWGHLTGRLVWDGPPPPMRKIKITKDVAALGDEVDDESLVVNAESRGIANVILWLRAKEPPIHPDYAAGLMEPVELWNEEGRFHPHIVGVRVGQELKIVNKDSIAHSTNISPPGERGISPLLPSGNTPRLEKYTRAQSFPVPVQCNIHPWMKGYVFIRGDPYFAISGEDGAFEIHNLPAGTWEFQFWHELTGVLDAFPRSEKGRVKLTIRSEETTDLGIVKLSPKLFEQGQRKP